MNPDDIENLVNKKHFTDRRRYGLKDLEEIVKEICWLDSNVKGFFKERYYNKMCRQYLEYNRPDLGLYSLLEAKNCAYESYLKKYKYKR